MTNSQALSLKALDWRGIRLFLGLCFGLTWTMEISALTYGTRFDALTPATVALLGLIMLIPAGSAFSVLRWLTREGFASAGLRLGPWQPYVFVWLGVPCLFGVIYILTAVLRLGVFSMDISLFLPKLPPLPPRQHLPPTPVLLGTFGFASLTVGLLITSLFTFGEEFGIVPISSFVTGIENFHTRWEQAGSHHNAREINLVYVYRPDVHAVEASELQLDRVPGSLLSCVWSACIMSARAKR